MRRPAETAGGAGAIALLIAHLAGVDDPTVLAAFGAAVGLVPGAVTLLLNAGGIRGAVLALWRGRRRDPGA